MYEYIKGKLTVKKIEYVALEVNGVAYKIYISLKTYENIKEEEEKLYIYTYVKEDAFRLYGFLDENERELFSIFLSAAGVGPKLAVAILSTYGVSELKDIISMEDIKRLSKVPGIGAKKGQKIVLEVKDKIKASLKYSDDIPVETRKISVIEDDVRMAFASLGYSDKEVDKIIGAENLSDYSSVEEAIAGILKKKSI